MIESKPSLIVMDIETETFDGKIDVEKDVFKIAGYYSYVSGEKKFTTNKEKIQQLVNDHQAITGHSFIDYDKPILERFGIDFGYTKILDTIVIAKKRMKALMNIEPKNFSLKNLAKELKLPVLKGEMDFNILKKDLRTITESEKKELLTYLDGDVEVTKALFEKFYDQFIDFKQFVSVKNQNNWSWMTCSSGALGYKILCNIGNLPEKYSDVELVKEKVGGFVLDPTGEEYYNVWYMDFASLYPSIFIMFNLFGSHVLMPNAKKWFIGNSVFEIKGKYACDEQHPISIKYQEMFDSRKKIKKSNPRLAYTYKIILNCFSKDTDIILSDGNIKNISKVKIGDKVLSLNPKTLKVEEKSIINFYKYEYNGEMYHFKSLYYDFLVTPEHKFLVTNLSGNNKNMIKSKELFNINKNICKGKYEFKNYNLNILDFINKNNLQFRIKSKNIHNRIWLNKYNIKRTKNNYNGNQRYMLFNYKDIYKLLPLLIYDNTLNITIRYLDRLKEHDKPIFYDVDYLSYLIGIYISEGSVSIQKSKKYKNGNVRGKTYCVSLSQYKKVNLNIYNKIIFCLNKLNLKYSKTDKEFKISGKIFYDFIVKNFGKLYYKHIINYDMFNILNLKKVFEGLIDGDGSKKSNLFTTKYDCLKKDFIKIVQLLGGSVYIKNDGCWRIIYNFYNNRMEKKNKTKLLYNDNIYCVTVEDNHTLMAGRNGKFNWTGNSGYGVMRSPIFKSTYYEHTGADCCRIGQKMNLLIGEFFERAGFNSVAGDTDSRFLRYKDESLSTDDQYKLLLETKKKLLDFINANVPFPSTSFDLESETGNKPLKYIKFVKDGDTYLKKNYLYITPDNKVKLVGFPIKKNNATLIGIHVFHKYLEPEIIKRCKCSFGKREIMNWVSYELEKDIGLASVEFKVKPYSTYKSKGCIQAQISKHYLNGENGLVRLIKNKVVGRIGNGNNKYCLVEEGKNLCLSDLWLDKLDTEFKPFIREARIKGLSEY